ncbi:MAG: hypothetical protein KGZ74_00360 [Chitinophagaceae bacterium]|nr:hypothetical protein [Chitinophagaceae bacterium]
MERFMYQDDSFERLLKQKADEYRMYPSDNSWNAIRNRLDDKNRFSWKLASFFTLSFVSLSLWVSVRQHQVESVTFGNDVKKQAVEQTVASSASLNSNINRKPRISRPAFTAIVSPEQSTVIIANERPAADAINGISAPEVKAIEPAVVEAAEEKTTEQIILKTPAEGRISSIALTASFQSAPVGKMPVTPTAETNPVAEPTSLVDEQKTDGELNYEVSVPVLVNSTRLSKKLQFYITPSASYRVLISDNRFTFGNLRDPNAVVSDRSSLGMEGGASMLFPISKRLSFKAGLQVNYTKYVVTASRYQPELTTINFTTYGSTQRTTDLRTNNGYFPEDVANSTLQLSIPLGLEFRLAGNRQFSFNLGAGLQPTYQLHATGLLVTNDLKNYIKAPDLLSRLNLNSNLETFFRWGSGDLQFQMGPQLRYQLFSNSKGKYPVQEHLVDYGLKFGIIKTLR